MTDLVRDTLQQVRDKLLDLSRRNRLLNYKETAKSIRIVDELPDLIYKFLVNDGKKMEFKPLEENAQLLLDNERQSRNLINTDHNLPDPEVTTHNRHTDNYLQTPFSPQVLERRSKKLLQESRTAIEETGSNMLFLAIGFLEWYEDDNSQEKCRSPLILLPVQIERTQMNARNNCYGYVLSYTGEDIETNLSLAVKLEDHSGLVLPTLGEHFSPEKYFDEVRQVVNEKKRWVVCREMVLGMFSFSKLLMYKDLDDTNWPQYKKLTSHPHIRQILQGKQQTEQEAEGTEHRVYGEDYNLDNDPRSVDLAMITDADSSQTSVIIDVIHEQQSIAVEGPPGTGKSQTITNMIGAALDSGKSVLFVAEKKAALEVVRTRLNGFGLGDFCLELHSHKTQKGQMHEDIKRRINRQFSDHRTLDRELADLRHHKNKLLEYTSLLHTVAGHDDSTIYEIFWALENCRSHITKEPLRGTVTNALSLTRQQLNDRASLISEIARLHQQLSPDVVEVWRGFAPTSFLPGDEDEVKKELETITEAIEPLITNLEADFSTVDAINTLNIQSMRVFCHASMNDIYPLPCSFSQGVAAKFNDPAQQNVLKTLQSQIEKYENAKSKATPLIQAIVGYESEGVGTLAAAARAFIDMGFSNKTPRELLSLASNYRRCLSTVEKLHALSDQLSPFWEGGLKSTGCCEKIAPLANALREMPAGIAEHRFAGHVRIAATQVLSEAMAEYQRLTDNQRETEKFFIRRYMPDESGLLDIAKGLRKYRGSYFAFFSSEFRGLQRKAKEFLVEPKTVKAKDLPERLERAADLGPKAASFCNNDRYTSFLGPSFKGLDTDWSHLETLVRWGQTVASAIGSEDHANMVFPELLSQKHEILDAAQQIQLLRTELDQLRATAGVGISDKFNEIIKTLGNILQIMDSHLPALTHYESLEESSCTAIWNLTQYYTDYLNAKHAVVENKAAAALLEEWWDADETNMERAFELFNWVQKLAKKHGMPKALVEWILAENTPTRLHLVVKLADKMRDFFKIYNRSTDSIATYFSMEEQNITRKPENSSLIFSIPPVLKECLDHIGSLVLWSDYSRTVDKAKKLGMEISVGAVEERNLGPDEAAALYRWAAYDSMAREIIAKHPVMLGFTRSSYEESRKKFADLDRRIIENYRQRVAYKASLRRVPVGNGYGPVRNHTEDVLLRNEIRKQKRHIPIRQLVRRSGKALQAYKPCWMMSPMSVAQYLAPGEIEFDLLIMDEASQVKPEDALGAIARAKQVVIVGDSKQLPPTSFFSRVDGVDGDGDSDGNAGAIADTESILDICAIQYPNRRLRWHYRSEHESLIAFSNRMFYDDELVIFPSPLATTRNYGLHHHYIENAQYQSGRNKVEAEAVVIAVIEHFRRHPDLSLGVATFNREQADLILDLLEKAQKENSWLDQKIRESEKEEPFFVKNLENVQGDERDVIFISVTYGPDHTTGKVMQRFGPLTHETGWRRLNVIVTRAKKRLELFTSMRSGQILAGGESRGPKMLKAYLQYAETGIIPEYGSPSGREPDSDFEVAVSRLLLQHGYTTVPQVGVAGFFIDLAVVHPEQPGQYILGIECDGAAYHSARSIRDRDRLRQEILEKKGWKIHRIWSTDWFKNREREVQRLLAAVKQRVAETVVFAERREDAELKVDLDKILSEHFAAKQAVRPIQAQPFVAGVEYGDEARLQEELVEYRKTNIQPNFPDMDKSILRDDMIKMFVRYKPTSPDEFRKHIPLPLRESTDVKQMQFLNDLFEIIEAYV